MACMLPCQTWNCDNAGAMAFVLLSKLLCSKPSYDCCSERDETTAFEGDRLRARARLHRPAIFSCNFVDDTYLLAASASQVSYMITSFALPLSAAHQFLAADKTAVLADPPTEARMRIWDKDEMRAFTLDGRRRQERGAGEFIASESVVVLGSCISSSGSASEAVTHRLRSAWRAYAGIRPQLQVHSQPLRLRLQLLNAVVLPSLRWGLETVWFCRPDRSCLRIFAKSTEPRDEFFRRRERVTSRWIKFAARGHWDQLQRYRFLNFYGHAIRLSEDHLLRDVLRWRSDAWWKNYREAHAKLGGAAGRRATDLGNATQTRCF